MRDAAIVEIGVRETATFCQFAEFAYSKIDDSGSPDPTAAFFFIHAFVGYCSTVAHLLLSEEIAPHAGGQTIAQLLEVPHDDRIRLGSIGEINEHYDQRLVRGLAMRGEVEKILDRNVGDRDAFEQEFSIFLMHYDPSVHVLTELEEEIDLARLYSEVANIRERASAWLTGNAVLQDRPAEVTIPPDKPGS